MSYMPDYGVGYFYSINTGNGDAFDKIGRAIRAYITNKLPKPVIPPAAPLPANAADYAGWYELDSPRVQMVHFLDRLTSLIWIHFNDGKLLITDLGDWNDTFIPVAGAQFRHVSKKDPAEPVATLALLTPNDEGRFVQGLGAVMKRIPTWLAIVEILAVVFVMLSMLTILIYAPFWLLGGISRRRRRPAERAMRFWPLIAVLSLITMVGVVIVSGDDFIQRMGNLTGWSLTVFLSTLLFAVASIASVVVALRSSEGGVRPGVRRFSRIVSIALLIATVYLGYWGLIGVRTWA